MSDLKLQERACIVSHRCSVWAGTDASDAKLVGFVDSATFSQSVQTQRAQGLNSIMPFSIDAVGASASISLSGFMSTKEAVQAADYGKGDITINSFFPNASIYDTGKLSKIPYIALREKDGVGGWKNICHANWAVTTSFQITSQGQSYTKGNVQMEAIIMEVDSDYQDNTLNEMGI